jgi:hypothetical protein
MQKNQILDVITYLGLTVDSVFIPLSRSRNKSEAGLTLNWVVTLSRNGRKVLSTDYSAGMAHCPSYKPLHKIPIMDYEKMAYECECGINAKTPDTIDVIYSLVSDFNVLDYASFGEWACEFGYEDSRKGELIYRACLEIALKLRSGIGENDLCLLRDTLEDY